MTHFGNTLAAALEFPHQESNLLVRCCVVALVFVGGVLPVNAKLEADRGVSEGGERVEIEARFVEASAEAVREAFSVVGVRVNSGPRILGQALGDLQGILGGEKAEIFWESLAVANDVNVLAQLNASVGAGRTDKLAVVQDFQYSVDKDGGKAQQTWIGTRLSLTSRLRSGLVEVDLKPWLRSFECVITTAAVEQPVFSDWRPELTLNLPVESSLIWGLGRHRLNGAMREILLIVKASHPRGGGASRGTVEIGDLNEITSSKPNESSRASASSGGSNGGSDAASVFQLRQQPALKEAPSETSAKVQARQNEQGPPVAPKNKP